MRGHDWQRTAYKLNSLELSTLMPFALRDGVMMLSLYYVEYIDDGEENRQSVLFMY